MAVIEGGTTAALAEIGNAAANAMHVTLKPTPHGALGHYRVAATTGALPAALAANAQLFFLRWLNASNFCVITYFRAQFQTLTLFTAGNTDFGFNLHRVTGVTAPAASGTDLGALVKTRMRTGMPASIMDVAGTMRISTTAALTAVGTLDALPIAQSLGDTQSVNPAAGTEEQRVNDPTLIFAPNMARGEHPLVLSLNEGLVLSNRTLWPAAGTGIVQIELAWAEVSAF
jgi:hypothetical protein